MASPRHATEGFAVRRVTRARGWLGLACGLVVALPIGVGASASAAQAAGTYVALGDSVAAPSDSYVHVLFDFLRSPDGGGLDTLHNRARFGEDSGTLRTNGQLAAARADIDQPSDTKVVTIDIGGNDRFACGGTEPSWHLASCPFAVNFEATLADLLAALGRDPGSEPLMAMTYYNPASGTGTVQEQDFDRGLLGTDFKLACAQNGDPRLGLNDRIACISATRGSLVADVYPAFKLGGQALMSGDGLHPNSEGHAAIAAEFRRALAKPSPVTPVSPVIPAPAPVLSPPPDLTAPVITDLVVSPRRFYAARRGGSIAARVGARVAYRVSEAGVTRFRVKRAVRGRRVSNKCVRLTRRNRGAQPCTRYVQLRGSFRRLTTRGSNRFRFTGRLAGKRLRPGRYRLRARVKDPSGNLSVWARAPFGIRR